jgi:hypothetical protein
LWSIVALGVLLRTIRYASYRSLWLDESLLSLNLLTKSYRQLAGSLDFNQGAPVGFLWLEKAATQFFGDSEYALRLPSFLAGTAAVVVFLVVAKRYLPRAAVPLALFLFVVIDPFVYYSSEAKQYGFDVLITLVLLWVFADAAAGPDSDRTTARLAVVGAVAVWLAHPAAFLLAGYGGVAMFVSIRDRAVRRVTRLAVLGVVWLASFGAEYVLSIRHIHQLQEIADESGSSGHQQSYVKGVLKGLYTIFNDPGQQARTVVGITAFAVAIGVVILWRSRWTTTALLVAPAVVTIAAGLAHRYPVGVRFILFLLPIGVLLLSAGVVSLVAATHGALRLAVAAVLGALLVVPPTATAVKHAVHPPDVEPAQKLIAEAAEGWRPSDVLYLYSTSQYAFRYYLSCHDCNSAERERERRLWPIEPITGAVESSPALVSESRRLVVGKVGPGGRVASYVRDLRHLRGHARVWILILHMFPATASELLQPLDALGTPLKVEQRGLSLLFLYDLRDRRG